MDSKSAGVIMLIALAWTTYATTYQVGPTRTYHTVGALPVLAPGDIIEIDPAIYNEVKRWTTAGTASQPWASRATTTAPSLSKHPRSRRMEPPSTTATAIIFISAATARRFAIATSTTRSTARILRRAAISPRCSTTTSLIHRTAKWVWWMQPKPQPQIAMP